MSLSKTDERERVEAERERERGLNTDLLCVRETVIGGQTASEKQREVDR